MSKCKIKRKLNLWQGTMGSYQSIKLLNCYENGQRDSLYDYKFSYVIRDQ